MSYRKNCFEYWKIEHKGGFWLPCKCPDCKGALFNAAVVPWEAAHLVARAHGGSDDPTNVVPMQKDCHRHLTSTVDVPRIAKGKRTAEKHYGVREKRGGFRKPPPGYKHNWKTGRMERVDD